MWLLITSLLPPGEMARYSHYYPMGPTHNRLGYEPFTQQGRETHGEACFVIQDRDVIVMLTFVGIRRPCFRMDRVESYFPTVSVIVINFPPA